MSDLSILFSERLRDALKSSHKTNKQVAKESEIHPVSLSKYLSGRIPNSTILSRLANTLNVTVDWLLGRVETREFEESEQNHYRTLLIRALGLKASSTDTDIVLEIQAAIHEQGHREFCKDGCKTALIAGFEAGWDAAEKGGRS